MCISIFFPAYIITDANTPSIIEGIDVFSVELSYI